MTMVLLFLIVLVACLVASVVARHVSGDGALAVALSGCFVGVMVALTVRFFLVDTFVVPTGSMIPTVEVNDLIMGDRLAPRSVGVSVGDVVTFDSPADDGTTLVKRVVATGGDRVDIVGGRLLVNGGVSPYGEGLTEKLGDELTYPLEVADGYVFVMGDNREDSADSRVFGAVPVSSVSSSVFFRLMPFDRMGGI